MTLSLEQMVTALLILDDLHFTREMTPNYICTHALSLFLINIYLSAPVQFQRAKIKLIPIIGSRAFRSK